jgi:hypothetical protein
VKFIQVPIAETVCPNRKRRKFREERTDENVRPIAAVTLGLTNPAP